MDERRPLCAEVSRESAEPLAATASRIENWILLEYRGLWSRDIVAGSGLSDQVKAYLREQLAALPRSRLLFIRRPERRQHPEYAFYVARTAERGSIMLGAELGGIQRPARSGPRRRARHRLRRVGAPGRGAAPRRLHAREEGPLLCQVRAPALRRCPRAGRGGHGLAGVTRRRRPVCREPGVAARRASISAGWSAPGSGRFSTRCSQAASPSSTTGGVPATRSPSRRPSGR